MLSQIHLFRCHARRKPELIGEELLAPIMIYPEIVELVKECDVHGLAHITGSGLLKLRRISDLGFEITDPLEPQPVFRFLQEQGVWMRRRCTANMGIGFVVVLDQSEAKEACRIIGPARGS